MKKLTLNKVNLETVTNAICDFCGKDWDNEELGIKAAFPFKYHIVFYRAAFGGLYDKYNKEEEKKFTPVICFDCIRQLAKLIK